MYPKLFLSKKFRAQKIFWVQMNFETSQTPSLYPPDTLYTLQAPIRHRPDTFWAPSAHFWDIPQILASCIGWKFHFQLGRGRVVAESMWWVGCGVYVLAGPHCIIMPLRGPTCKIARFQAELKFPSWTECGNKLSHRSWGDAHLSFGAAQAPPTKMGST